VKLRYKITGGITLFFVLAFSVLAIVVSYDSDCLPIESTIENKQTMQAITYHCYGAPEVLKLENAAKPIPSDNEVLVKVHAAGVNPLDWHYMRGAPYIMRLASGVGSPNKNRLGVDFSGTIESIGKDVTKFKVGDEVFGGAGGAFAEYLTVSQDRTIALKPENMSFSQAATVPVAALTALQALRDQGKIKAGQKVLINGASGGVGTFAVQIAKSFGAEVTGVCSTRNIDMVRSIGADHVFDYKKQDYTQSGQRYDLIIDNVGNHSISKNRVALKPGGTLVSVGGGKGNWIGPLIGPIKSLFVQPFADEQLISFVARLKGDDLNFLAELMKAGKLTPVIEKHFSLSELPLAIKHSEQGHTRGKIVVDIN